VDSDSPYFGSHTTGDQRVPEAEKQEYRKQFKKIFAGVTIYKLNLTRQDVVTQQNKIWLKTMTKKQNRWNAQWGKNYNVSCQKMDVALPLDHKRDENNFVTFEKDAANPNKWTSKVQNTALKLIWFCELKRQGKYFVLTVTQQENDNDGEKTMTWYYKQQYPEEIIRVKELLSHDKCKRKTLWTTKKPVGL